jgi:hypothetical protein
LSVAFDAALNVALRTESSVGSGATFNASASAASAAHPDPRTEAFFSTPLIKDDKDGTPDTRP